MAYMVKEGLADFAITEDSDLIVYGCPKIMVKLNADGYGKVFDYNLFKNEKKNRENGWDEKLRTLQSMDREQFVLACILSGCEYVRSINRVGIRVLLKNYLKFGSCEKVLKHLQISKNFKDKIPEGYMEEV